MKRIEYGVIFSLILVTIFSFLPVTSNPKVFAAEPAIIIEEQSSNISVQIGDKFILYVVAHGDRLSYQWQYKIPSSTTWKNAVNTSAKNASWTLKMSSAYDGRVYRCLITDENGATATSDDITITLKEAPAITINAQPENVDASIGSRVTFNVAATGDNLTYQWQYKEDSSWINISHTGANSANLVFDASEEDFGRSYRCVVKDKNENIINLIKLYIFSFF